MPDSSLKYCLSSRLHFFLFLHLAAAIAGAAVDLSSIPKPTGYVSDLANVLTPADKADLESFCQKVDQQLSAQFAIVTINTLGDTPMEDFTLDLGRKWGVGPKGSNEGLVVLLAIQDRKQRIEVGQRLEPYITDAFAGDTERDMRTLLRAGNYGGALKQSTLALAQQISQGKGIAFSETLPLPQRPPSPQHDNGGSLWPILIFIGIFLLIAFLNRRGGGGRGAGPGAGFWTGMAVNSMLNSGRGGGGWGDGGGFGGGSGGGGGFGGFGGGGDFGGGGASSDW